MIPAEAVEAAEQAVSDAMYKYGPDGHVDGYQEIARAALEAAAPHMLAGAWEEGRDAEFQRSVMKRQSDPNPYRPTP